MSRSRAVSDEQPLDARPGGALELLVVDPGQVDLHVQGRRLGGRVGQQHRHPGVGHRVEVALLGRRQRQLGHLHSGQPLS